jgi:sterol desaturase/sphingolipid hydroxylase (fatty acid hydroxylase superfamily)
MAVVTFPIVVFLVLIGYHFRNEGVPLPFGGSYDLYGEITSNETFSFRHVLIENYLIFLILYSFVHLLCYVEPQRALLVPFKFNPKYPPVKLVMKEFMMSFRGVFCCCCYEAGMNYLVATGYKQWSTESFYGRTAEGKLTLAEMIISPLLMYLWSDIHFYVVHRALHCKWLYSTVHKYHHESFNPDPFSGLSMHPVETMLYFTSPLIAGLIGAPTWYYRMLFKALLIFPLEGHAGFGSWDIENSHNHYIHHAKFNWNYGSSPLMDHLCGTNYKHSLGSSATKKSAGSLSVTGGDKDSEASRRQEAIEQARMVGCDITDAYAGGASSCTDKKK